MLNNSEQPNSVKFCSKCGQKISAAARFCPKCGAQLEVSDPGRPQSTVNNQSSSETHASTQTSNSTVKAPLDHFALLGVVFGGISWLLNFWGVVGIIAVVFSILALNRHLSGTNKTIAIIGLVSGVVNIIYALSVLESY
ncbi:Double zinc ribbon [Lentilactobacillus parabuchneri]|uniref:Double zinc ribbon n=1 Tax=Lentilactobacillus parabuchneri TaxID=152331 RepID=A0A1X1FEF2_9LACO|nr:Double zinc ribbon [Lentilactobacillus parabuchneri]ORN00490.1 Double zinc ribbon [Lentilactobacillus parabuchneri]ORN04495.1 Double zinc ribbon [Lentilactobacillus parabuchneri]ORN08495.1 Double zinc ribbon [Lentilactobacillus parabuchneri]ORN09049.1 Double zinc ribbon [Lentilactobacillus parabuchneri]